MSTKKQLPSSSCSLFNKKLIYILKKISQIQPQNHLLPLHNSSQNSNNTSLNKCHKAPYPPPILHSLTPTTKHVSIAALLIILPILILKKLHQLIALIIMLQITIAIKIRINTLIKNKHRQKLIQLIIILFPIVLLSFLKAPNQQTSHH